MNLNFILNFDPGSVPELNNGWIIGQHHPPPDRWIKGEEK
jgi:hypothetical protein